MMSDCGLQAPHSTPLLAVEVISDYRAFLDLETTWNKLVDEAGVEFPFVRHEWIRAYWASFGRGARLHILLVKEGARITAIAPLMQDTGQMYGIPVRRLAGIGNVYTERFDWILTRRPEESSEAVWTYLADHSDDWDVLELRQLPSTGQALKRFPPGMKLRFLVGEWRSSEAPYLRLGQSWESYFKSLKKHHRAKIRKCLQRLESTVPVELEVVASNVDLDKDIQDAFRLEAVPWKLQGGTAIRSHPDTVAFYRRVLEEASERGGMRLYFLKLGNKRIAVQLALLFCNKLYMLKTGYDPEYAPCSPGHLLYLKILDEAWRNHLDEVDFLGDFDQCKGAWTKEVRPHVWLYAFPKRLKSLLLYCLKFRVVPKLHALDQYPFVRRLWGDGGKRVMSGSD
jgi:CelD/BcsL family acetyltransferase involved in cellulose biosynthesis